MNKLACFTVVKPQGLKGELKAKILADGISNVKNVKTLYDDNGNAYKVKSVKDAFGGFAFISLENVVTRNDSELFRGVTFYAEKSEIAFYPFDFRNVKTTSQGFRVEIEEYSNELIKKILSFAESLN